MHAATRARSRTRTHPSAGRVAAQRRIETPSTLNRADSAPPRRIHLQTVSIHARPPGSAHSTSEREPPPAPAPTAPLVE